MAESSSPAFNPPMGTVKDNDPMVSKVPMDKTDWGFRKGAAPALDGSATGPISHVGNGKG